MRDVQIVVIAIALFIAGIGGGFLVGFGVYQPRIQDLQNQISELEDEVSNLSSQITDLRDQISSLQTKKPADEYFEIFDQTVNDGEFQDPPLGEGGSYENSSVLIIYSVSYKLRAVGGDAHNVVVESWGQGAPVEFEVIPMGQSRYVEQWSTRVAGYRSEKAENGKFPFAVRITCDEAEGTITVYL